jgi:hypothetical protein
VIKAVLRGVGGYSVELPDLSGIGVQIFSSAYGITVIPDINFEGFFVTRIVKNKQI